MSYLSKKGYVIKKESITSQELSKLKLELVGRPLINDSGFKTKNETYQIYIETKNKIYIPKMYGITHFGNTKELPDYIGKSIDPSKLECKCVLYDNQIEPVNLLLDSLNCTGGGILSLNVGGGKTASSIYVLSKLAKKTIVVVNKIPLMNQWVEEINKFLPNLKVGTLQGQKNVDILDCDVVIAMLQSMSRIDYPDEFFEDFGLTLIDECHNFSSKVFSKIMFKLTSKYTIGLSATPNRADGCEYVMGWHIGDIVYKSKEAVRKSKEPIIKFIKIDSSDYIEEYNENKWSGLKTLQFTTMLSHLVKMPKRNKLILEIIREIITKESTRKILVLSDRRGHLETLVKLLNESNNITFTYGLCLGNMKKKDFEAARTSQCIFATYQSFSEGVSEKNLDTLFLITPKKYIDPKNKNNMKKDSGKLNQIIGRIFRRDHTDINPMIIDINDNFSVYKSQFNSRKTFYKSNLPTAIYQNYSINFDNALPLFKNLVEKKELKNELIKDKSKLITDYCLLE